MVGSAANIELSVGNIAEKYLIGKIMGYGSFGEIRKVKDKRSGDWACVKVMTKRLM